MEDVAVAEVTGALPRAIAAHRLLSNGRSAALVRPDTEIDWWCTPDFDSPPLAWSLLDNGGGFARWQVDRIAGGSTRPAGPASYTVAHAGGGRVEFRDGLVGTGSGGSALVRLVRTLDAPVLVEHELHLRGFPGSDEEAWRVVLPAGAGETRPGRLVTPIQADDRWTGLAVVAGDDSELELAHLMRALDEAEAAFDNALATARLPRRHPDRAADALAVLRACTYQPTGAVIAAATTSLPEVPGGDRQWDYRYCWLRDAGLAVSVAALLGQRAAAEDYLRFVRQMAAESVPESPLATVTGERVPSERTVDIEGWASSSPVRIGNAAATQVQHDAVGLLVEAVSVFLQTGGSLDDDTWALVVRIADAAANASDDEPSSGIWELRDERLLVSADIGRWLALDRAIWIARGWRPFQRRSHWKRARRRLRDRVLGALEPDGGLPQSYDRPFRPDASALMAPLFGMLGRDDARAHAVVDAIIRDLGSGPFLYRYPPDGDDGLFAGEGTFLPGAWWAVSALAAIGRVDEARDRLDELCLRLPRLMPEEIDPLDGTGLGNVPLVWSHAEAARALYIVDAAERRKRWGSAGLWVWRVSRYATLRWRSR